MRRRHLAKFSVSKSPIFRSTRNIAESAPFAVFVYDYGASVLPLPYSSTAWGNYFLPFFREACLAIRETLEREQNQAPRLSVSSSINGLYLTEFSEHNTYQLFMHNKRSKTGRGLLLAILLLTFLHQEGQAQSYTVDGVKYYVSDGNATVMGLEDTSIPELEIPEEIQVDGNTVPVTAIRKEAFFQSNLTEVRMSNAILTIGASCFRASKQLKKVVLSEAITEIPDWAFAGCSSLDDIYLRVGVTSIGQRAFSGCNFTTIVLPESLMQIGSQAFNL